MQDPSKREPAFVTSHLDLSPFDAAELPEWARNQIEAICRIGRAEVELRCQKVKLDNHDVELKRQESRIARLERQLASKYARWLTARAYANGKGMPIDYQAVLTLGRRAASICRRRGITPRTTRHEQFGTVNVYPVDVLAEAARPLETAA